MKKYENVYSWKVIDEIKAGETVYVVDKHAVHNSTAIQEANDMKAEYLLNIIERDNSDNRYEFFKVIESEDKTE